MRTETPAQNGGSPADEFLWGVATSAYQTEGGYNGAGQPQTNWAAAERASEVAPSGNAAEFWTRFRSDFALCRELGLNAFRLSIEWSRVQPAFENRESAPPLFDYTALDHYAEMLAECRRAGLEPVVTLHHFVHPVWLGADPWLRAETALLFARFVDETVRYLNCRLIEAYDLPPIRYYITVNEPNMLVLNTYLGHQFPSAVGPGLHKVATAFSQLLRAHILAYNCVHDIYREQGWPEPAVSLNNHCCDIYSSDKLWLDVLCLRTAGIRRTDLDSHLRAQSYPLRARLQKSTRSAPSRSRFQNRQPGQTSGQRNRQPVLQQPHVAAVARRSVWIAPRADDGLPGPGLLRSVCRPRSPIAGVVGPRVPEQIVPFLDDELRDQQVVGLARIAARPPLLLPELLR